MDCFVAGLLAMTRKQLYFMGDISVGLSGRGDKTAVTQQDHVGCTLRHPITVAKPRPLSRARPRPTPFQISSSRFARRAPRECDGDAWSSSGRRTAARLA